ncbi:hypothetical protein QE152_g5432 [Popillia japonica]|uniref:Uncharacterized protein n=1 Tax=Popillia japonica TaxID=7064 RepID=A0AAW1MRT7_POPJA
MAQTNLPTIERLVGRENYNTCKFAMQALLEHEDLWGCVTGDAMYTADTKKVTMQALLEHEDLWGCVTGDAMYTADTKKVTKARAKIILLIDPINYIHIQDTTDAKGAWDKLQCAFEDSGLTRRVGLLR